MKTRRSNLVLLLFAFLAVTPALATAQNACPDIDQTRTATEVLLDYRAALAQGDVDTAVCNYARDAVVISDGGIDRGRTQIASSLEFSLTLFEGTLPVVVKEIMVQAVDPRTSMVRTLFTIDTPRVIVPDGIDTYIIRNGLIVAQTSHAFPVFVRDCLPRVSGCVRQQHRRLAKLNRNTMISESIF
jgi:ketosteroid isomerase-like protein